MTGLTETMEDNRLVNNAAKDSKNFSKGRQQSHSVIQKQESSVHSNNIRTQFSYVATNNKANEDLSHIDSQKIMTKPSSP